MEIDVVDIDLSKYLVETIKCKMFLYVFYYVSWKQKTTNF